MRSKIKKTLFYGIYLMFTVGLLMEVAYRWQWVDFYGTEWRGLNRPEDLTDDGRPTMLLIGDSFTADPNGYVSMLRDSLPQWRILNGAVPGTGARQASLMAPGRVKQSHPTVYFYQIYIGNDLLDIKHRPQTGTISFFRRIYWKLSDHLLVVPWANYKLGAFKSPVFADTKLVDTTFSIEHYSSREKLLIQAEPELFSQSASLTGPRAADMDELLQRLDGMRAGLPPNCKTVVLVIPHCAQVNQYYLDCMKALGGRFPDSIEWASSRNRFVETLKQHYDTDTDIKILDALPLFETEDYPGHRLYYANDPHLNVLGQRVLGSWLVNHLKTY